MFSGIIETTTRIREIKPRNGVSELVLERPPQFDDVKKGDSIAVNGVCLTVENFDSTSLFFALGPETLRVTGWESRLVSAALLNLERSLRLGDRIHGHLVLGHVDAMAPVLSAEKIGESCFLEIAVPPSLRTYVWTKGSVAINGVSLTVNSVAADRLSVCLIPETLKRTNLGGLRTGDYVTFEVDNFARGFLESRSIPGPTPTQSEKVGKEL